MMRTFLTAVVVLVICGPYVPVEAEEADVSATRSVVVRDSSRLDEVLGIRSRLNLSTASDRSPRMVFGNPVQPVSSYPEPVVVTLQAATEGLVFLAACQSKSVPAMAAVAAMSLWAGTLRRGIDATANAVHDPEWHAEDLHRLSEQDLAVFEALWRAGHGVTERNLYGGVSGFACWRDLSDTLRRLEKRKLIERRSDGHETTVRTEVRPTDVARVLVALGQTDRAVRILSHAHLVEDTNERTENGHSASAEQPGAARAGGVDP